jgi:hypothetical protein
MPAVLWWQKRVEKRDSNWREKWVQERVYDWLVYMLMLMGIIQWKRKH